MRQILFHGKTVKTGEWIQGCLTYYIDAEFHSFIEDPITMEKLEVIPESVGEYTGINDKYGKKIFEGDIVECEDRPIRGRYIVAYNYTGFEAQNLDNTAKHQSFNVAAYWGIKVIGHFYDMPIDTHILKDDTESSEEDL